MFIVNDFVMLNEVNLVNNVSDLTACPVPKVGIRMTR